jgi:hypothetical protein
MTDRMNPAEISKIEELLKKVASLGMVRRNGEFQDEQPVYEITELGQRVIPDMLDDDVDGGAKARKDGDKSGCFGTGAQRSKTYSTPTTSGCSKIDRSRHSLNVEIGEVTKRCAGDSHRRSRWRC